MNTSQKTSHAANAGDGELFKQVTTFLEKSSPHAATTLTEERLKVLATTEAANAAANSEGVIAVGDDGLTAGMRQARVGVVSDFEKWRTTAEKLKANLAQRMAQTNERLHELEFNTPQVREQQLAAAIDNQRASLTRNSSYARVTAQLPHLQSHYENLRDGPNLGVEPEERSRLVYALVLFLFFVVDMIANFEVFERKFTPALATLATVLVAGAIAWPAHVHGRYFKQFIMLFRTEINRVKRILSHSSFVLSSILLLLGLAALFWARYSFLLDTSPNPTPDELFRAVSPTIGINVGLWFASAVYSWWWHERVPELREASVRYFKAKERLEKLAAPVEHEIQVLQNKDTLAQQSEAAERGRRDSELTNAQTLIARIQNELDARRKTAEQSNSTTLLAYKAALQNALTEQFGDSSVVGFSEQGKVMSVQEFMSRGVPSYAKGAK